MTAVSGAFTDAAGEPCEGTITLVPKQVRSAVLDDGILGGTRIRIALDEYGEFDADVDPGDYRIDIRLKNAETVSREVSIPWADTVNLRDLLAEYEPTQSETTTDFGQGIFSFEIPWWAAYIDVVLVGGGGGGDDGVTLSTGKGGEAGSWTTATLVRGTDIPWESTVITGYVGAGGVHNEGNGEATNAIAPGMTLLAADGGAGGASDNTHGVSPGNQTFNNKTYVGGAEVTSLGDDGNSPGGGGAGGAALGGDAGAGAAGRAFFRAYR